MAGREAESLFACRIRACSIRSMVPICRAAMPQRPMKSVRKRRTITSA
jgi:hypothetical protein